MVHRTDPSSQALQKAEACRYKQSLTNNSDPTWKQDPLYRRLASEGFENQAGVVSCAHGAQHQAKQGCRREQNETPMGILSSQWRVIHTRSPGRMR